MPTIPPEGLNALLEASMSALEKVFADYGILLVVFNEGDGGAACNRPEEEMVEVAIGILKNREKVTPT